MQYVVNSVHQQQIAIDADSPAQAIEKVRAGQGNIIALTENMSASPRPQQPAPIPRG